jgi:DNA (cytosine-5)-methyltransferase 1
VIVDLFAGVGGWTCGLESLGLTDVGFELDRHACATRAAAGYATIRADIATYPLDHFRDVDGLIASPPCQDFSVAGARRGINGDRGQLVTEVLRWAEALRPRWIACEQVPPVLPIWRDYLCQLSTLGYSGWAGILNAADYGVPQTRKRAFLLAHRDRPRVTTTGNTRSEPRRRPFRRHARTVGDDGGGARYGR